MPNEWLRARACRRCPNIFEKETGGFVTRLIIQAWEVLECFLFHHTPFMMWLRIISLTIYGLLLTTKSSTWQITCTSIREGRKVIDPIHALYLINTRAIHGEYESRNTFKANILYWHIVLVSLGGSDATKKYHKYHRPSTMTKYGDALCVGVLEKDEKGKKIFHRMICSIFRNWDAFP